MRFFLYLVGFLFLSSISLHGSALDDYRSGMRYLDGGGTANTTHAIPYFKRALRKNPYYFKALRSLGIAYQRLRYFVLAEKFLRRALVQQSTHIETNLHYAEVLLQRGKLQQAKKHINLVLIRWPRNVRAIFTDALYYIKSSRNDLALHRLRTVLSIVPSHYRSYIQMGNIYTKESRYRLAENAFLQALRYNSTTLLPYFSLAKFYYDRGRINKSYQNLLSALLIDKSHQQALVLMGKVLFKRALYYRQGQDKARWQEAHNNYTILVSLFPFNYYYRYTLALIYARLARFESRFKQDAVDSFSHALRMRDNDEIIRYNFEEFAVRSLPIRSAVRKKLAQYHIEMGDLLTRYNLRYRATVAYRRAIRLSPVSITARKKLAILYRERQRYELFLKALKILYMLDSNNTMLHDRITFYKRIVSQLPSQQNGIEQYNLQSSAPSVVVFDLFSLYNARHQYFELEKVLGTVIRDGLQPFSVVRLIRLKGDHSVDSLVQARAKARAARSDYFVHGRYIKGRYFTVVELFMRSTVTGEVVARFRVSRRGNRQFFKIGATLAEKIARAVPRIGQIIRKRGDKVVINIGANHGVKKGQVYNIYPGYGFRYHFLKVFGRRLPALPVGQIKIERVDEAVSFAVISQRKTFDAIASYQYVIPKKKQRKKKQ